MGRGGLFGTSFEGEELFAMMNSNNAEEPETAAESNLGIGKFLRGEEPYFPWSATGIRSPFHAAHQRDSTGKVGSLEEEEGDLNMSLDGFGLTSFPHQEELLAVQPNNSIVMNPDDKFMPGISSSWVAALENFNTENLTAALQLPNKVLDPPFPHHIPSEYFNASPGAHRNYYESTQVPWGDNSETPHLGPTPGPFRHFPRSLFQVRKYSFSGKLSQPSKRQRPFMLQRWIEKIVPALEWPKLRLKLLEAEHGGGGGGGDKAGNGELERSPDAVAQAVNHKMKERIRRSEFNGKMQTLMSLVPTIKKKDKVSVLTSTIEYIRELSSPVGTRSPPLQKPFSNKTSAKLKSDNLLSSRSEEQEEVVEAGGGLEGSRSAQILPVTAQIVAAADTPSSSTQQHLAPDFVLVEVACGGDAFNVNLDAETDSSAQVLIHLLKVLKDLNLHLLKMECSSEHGRLNATMSVAMPLDQNLSCDQVREALQSVLDYGTWQSTSSD